MDFTRVSTHNRENFNNYNPGKLSQRVKIFDPNITTARNKHGELIEEPKLLKTVWADVVPIRGIEYLEAGLNENKIYYRVSLRYLPWLKEGLTLQWKGKKLYITAVLDVVGKGRFTDCLCQELVYAGSGAEYGNFD